MKRFAALAVLTIASLAAGAAVAETIQLGPRPYYLISKMQDSDLKTQLEACADGPFERTLFSIGHRGAPMQFPEHSVESYVAAARMGAGILECDVTFTKDHQLVCRHAQDDLHTTTNILATELSRHCTQPFTPAGAGKEAIAECRSSDITLADFRKLRGKMDASNPDALTVEAYMDGTPGWRTDLYAAAGGTLMTHAESIDLFKELGVKFTPELKAPAVEMPHDGLTQQDFAQKLIDDYKAAGIPPQDVWPQSFNLDDVLYWITNEPEFGKQAVYLDGRYDDAGFDPMNPKTLEPSMQALAESGVRYLAPPLWVLVTLQDDEIVPSAYAEEAKRAGLKLITWTLERSGPLSSGNGGWYHQSIAAAVDHDGVTYELLDVLAQDVGVVGMFSDWPATVTYYASCMGLD